MHRSLVLIHGSYGRPESWAGVRARLPSADGVGLVTPTLPGWGQRRKEPSVPLSMAELASDVVSQLESTDSPVVIAGHSIGGACALEIALDRLFPVDALVLIEPNSIPVLALTEQWADYEEHRRESELFRAAVAAGEPDAAALAIEVIYGPERWAQLPTSVRTVLNTYAPAMARDSAATMTRTYTLDSLASVSIPTVIVYGTETWPKLRHVADTLRRVMPAAELVTIQGADHGLLDTHPGEVANAIGRVLQGVSPAFPASGWGSS